MKRVVDGAPRGFGAETDRCDVIFLFAPLTVKRAVAAMETKEGVDRLWAGTGVVYFSRLTEKATSSRMGRVDHEARVQEHDDPKLGHRDEAPRPHGSQDTEGSSRTSARFTPTVAASGHLHAAEPALAPRSPARAPARRRSAARRRPAAHARGDPASRRLDDARARLPAVAFERTATRGRSAPSSRACGSSGSEERAAALDSSAPRRISPSSRSRKRSRHHCANRSRPGS